MKKITTQDLTKIALLVSLICISSYISIPLPFSSAVISAQTIIINLVALMLTPLQAGITILVYLLLGIIGLPVFSAGSSGITKLLSPSGGYYFGFLIASIVISLLKGKKYNVTRYSLISIFVGMPIIYFVGAIYMKFMTGFAFETILLVAVMPFIPLDILKCIIASIIAKPVNKVTSILSQNNYQNIKYRA